MAAAGTSGAPWDINNGVMLVNCRLHGGRRLVRLWLDAFLAIPDARLAGARDWLDLENDQDLLQSILRSEPALAAGVLVESQDLLNSRRASFIRQHLRADTSNLARRIASIAAEVVGKPTGSAAQAATLDDRAMYRLRRPNSHELALAEAPHGPGSLHRARMAVESWASAGRLGPSAPSLTPLVAALERGDISAVDEMMRSFGRLPMAEGLLGGARQHHRAVSDASFARARALRTKDALAAMAEACAAPDVENPDHGLWGFNVQLPASELFDRVAVALGTDLSPPTALGCYLGISIADQVLHLRMVEALHTAWRARQMQQLLRLNEVVDLDGGVGFRAFYAARLNVQGYSIDERDAGLAAIQSYVIGAMPFVSLR